MCLGVDDTTEPTKLSLKLQGESEKPAETEDEASREDQGKLHSLTIDMQSNTLVVLVPRAYCKATRDTNHSATKLVWGHGLGTVPQTVPTTEPDFEANTTPHPALRASWIGCCVAEPSLNA